MSRSGSITIEWGGQERMFRFRFAQIEKLQEKTGCGPLGIAARCAVSVAVLRAINSQDFISLSRMDLSQVAEKTHTREALRQGLLGAGVDLPTADKLIREYVDERPLDESLEPATAVCLATIYGTEDEQAAGSARSRGGGLDPLPDGKFRFGEDGVYAIGAACGFTPRDVDDMSVWEFTAAVGGYVKANSTDDEQTLNSAEVKSLSNLIDQPPIWH